MHGVKRSVAIRKRKDEEASRKHWRATLAWIEQEPPKWCIIKHIQWRRAEPKKHV